MNKTLLRLILVAVGIVVAVTGSILAFDFVPVKGSEVGVLETWGGGVQKDSLPAKTYLAWPNERIYIYSLATQVLEMGDNKAHPTYLVQSADNQDMHFSLRVQWHIEPEAVPLLHKSSDGKPIEEKFLLPELLTVVNDKATVKEAIMVYSGEGRVQLHKEINDELKLPDGPLKKMGLVIENCVIEKIQLDPEYVQEITARQIAMVRETRAVQEEKAAQAEALKVKAEAQAELNRQVTIAQGLKEAAVIAAQGENEKEILKAEAEAQKVELAAAAAAKQVELAAEAEAKKTVLAATAQKEAGELTAASILAIGKAQAEADTMRYTAFGAAGADNFVKIEVSKNLATAFGNIKGYLPENMSVFTLGESFTKAVESVTSGVQPASK